jgi:integrase/recombinase XerC
LIDRDALTGFRDYLHYEKRYSSHTVEGYSNDIHQFTSFLADQYGTVSPTEVNHQHIRSWVVSMLKHKMSPVSVRRKLSSLSQWYKWLRKKGLTGHNPLINVHLPKVPQRLPSAIQESALRQLWHNLGTDSAETGHAQLRDKAMLALLYGSGLRRSELIALKWKDIDFRRKTLLIIGKGKKYRQLPLQPESGHILQLLRQKQDAENLTVEYVFLTDSGKPCYPKFVHNRVVEMLKTVTTADKKSPHVLRHSMATHMMDHGAELNAVKTLLGHSSLAATQVYTHNSISRLKEVYRKSHPGSTHT